MEAGELDPTRARETGLERRVAELERANEELRRANAALARERLGKRDAAAASVLARMQLAEARADKVERSISYRLTAPIRVFKPLMKWVGPWLAHQGERIRQRLGR